MRYQLFAGAAMLALSISSAAHAQSTGSIEFDEGNVEEVVVTGTRGPGDVAGIVIPDTTRARNVLTDEFIQRQAPGQSVNDIINQLPGVSFQNNDPFGSAGGTLTIRGFDSTRISQTFDGVPLNDSGNYAIYSNQQLDPELIEQVNVNLGSTDLDSPTAGASGSTVNYRTRLPDQDFGVMLRGSVGDFSFFRIFGAVDTGEFTPWGTRAFFSASTASNDNVYNNFGKIEKQQYNVRVYQPLGASGDFVSLAGHYNQNRNNFFGSIPLRTDRTFRNSTTGAVTGTRNVPDRFPLTRDERFYTIAPCQIDVAQAGVADAQNSCGSTFDERLNPSNTGNIRGASRFTLTDGLILTVDPSYQFTKANGGGTLIGSEGTTTIGGAPRTGYVGTSSSSATQFFFGRDLNGDGDLLDTVRLLAPNQTRTHRIGVITNLRYELSDTQTVRLAYTYDRARHRQNGPTGFLRLNGTPNDPFPMNDPVLDRDGNALTRRDRLSFAILHQVAGQYRGEFFDNRLVLDAGVRVPFLRRNLTNYCFTKDAAGILNCFSGNDAAAAAYAAANPTVQGPQQRVLDYSAVLPNVGFTFDLTNAVSLFANYSRGLQVPGTDNLYNSFFFAPGTDGANPDPETTDNFDAGVRYRTGAIQAQITGWYTNYSNRLAGAYDVDLDRTIYRNLGTVKKYGVDGNLSVQPIPEFSVYVFGSYLDSEIQDDLVIGTVTGGANPGQRFAPTAGKRESGAPIYTFGGGMQAVLGPIELGTNVKRTGPRFIYDTNEPVRQLIAGQLVEVFPDRAPAYWLVDVNARVGMEWAGLNDQTYFQFNLLNVFDTRYVGGFNANSTNQSFNVATGAQSFGGPPFAQIGYPRTFMGTLTVGF